MDYKTFAIDVELVFGKLILLQNTKLVIKYGERYGLIAKNGAGKTALLNALYHRKMATPEQLDMIYVKQEEAATDMSVLETLLTSHPLYESNQRLTYLETVLEDDSILNEYDVLSKIIGTDFIKAKITAQKILLGLGFDNLLKSVKDFSGGWRMRISLAKALFMTPTLLLLDEPTNHLDLHANLWLSQYLQSYPKTILVISHDQYFIDKVCTTIIHIHDYQLHYYHGNYEKFLHQSKMERAKQEKDWIAYEKKIKMLKQKGGDVQKLVKPIKPSKEYQVKLKFLQPSVLKGDYIKMENVSFGYDKMLLNDVSMVVHSGHRIAIVGANGVGKSTCLKMMVGDLLPTLGKVITLPNLKIGHYNQHFEESLPFEMSGIEYLHHLNKEVDLTLAHQYLSKFGLESMYHKIKIGLLSGGQKARVKFASFGILKPHVLVLDEPSNHLDLVTIESLVDSLTTFEGAIVMVTHNFDMITKLNATLWVAEHGSLKEYEGDYDDYIEEITNLS